MSNEALINTFWKLDDKKLVVWFDGKSTKDRDKFLRFLDTRITKDKLFLSKCIIVYYMSITLYTKNVQFDTNIQPVYGNSNLIYRSIVNYLGVSKYYHKRRDIRSLHYFNFLKVKPNLTVGTNMYLYATKEGNCTNVSATDLDWLFPDKYFFIRRH